MKNKMLSLGLLSFAIVVVACSKSAILGGGDPEQRIKAASEDKKLEALSTAQEITIREVNEAMIGDYLAYQMGMIKKLKDKLDLGLIDPSDETPTETRIRKIAQALQNCVHTPKGTDAEFLGDIGLLDEDFGKFMLKERNKIQAKLYSGGSECTIPFSFETNAEVNTPEQLKGVSMFEFAPRGTGLELFKLKGFKLKSEFDFRRSQDPLTKIFTINGTRVVSGQVEHAKLGTFQISAKMTEGCSFKEYEVKTQENEPPTVAYGIADLPCSRQIDLLIEQGSLVFLASVSNSENPRSSNVYKYNNVELKDEDDFALLFRSKDVWWRKRR